MVELKIIQGGRERVVSIARDEIVVGRSSDCDVVIDDRHVSSRHAKILYGLVVADLDSLNGTFLDGERVSEATPILGRTLQLGGEADEVRILVRLPEPSSEAAAPATPDLRAATTLARSLFDQDALPLLSRLRRERPRESGGDADATEVLRRSGSEAEAAPGATPELPRTVATSFLLSEMLTFLREAEQAMQNVAAGFTDTPAPEAVLSGDRPLLRDLFQDVLDDPANPEMRESFRAYVRGLRRWLSIWLQAYPAAADRLDDQLASVGGAEVRERLRRLARDCADEILRAGYRHGA